MMLLGLLLTGCEDAECATTVGPARDLCVDTLCADESDLGLEACLYSQVQAESSAGSVRRLARRMNDPVARDAAVLQWAASHRGDVQPADATSLCGLLSPREKDTCLRSVNSPHLSP